MSSNASKLYQYIKNNPEHSQALFRQALQDPHGALEAICDLGRNLELPVTAEEVKAHLETIDDEQTKQWVIKARGGL